MHKKAVVIVLLILFSYNSFVLGIQPTSQKLSISSPINVTSDEDFVSFGFSGSGTESNPYKIENLDITTLNETGIRVGYTTKHFVIRNCHVTGGGGEIGIFIAVLEEGTGTIENNLIEKCETAISVYESNKAKVIDNRIKNCSKQIYMTNSIGGLIESNTMYKPAGNGIYVTSSESIEIFNNTYSELVSVIGTGIWLKNSENCEIAYNTIEDTHSTCIFLEDETRDNTIHHNNLLCSSCSGSLGYDEGAYNQWYQESKSEGNYWSNYLGHGDYEIAGPAGAYDIYPLKNPSEYVVSVSVSWNGLVIGILTILSLSAIISLRRRV